MAIDFAFLDSGTGGIPYMLYLKQKCPAANVVYLADSKHFPYGTKSPRQVTECALEAAGAAVAAWSPGAVVVACNTISVTALDALRAQFPGVPVVGTVPAIKLAAAVTENGRIGLLATEGTVRNPYVDRLIHDFAADCTVIRRGDAELVSFVEHRCFSAAHAERLAAVRPAIDFFSGQGCDTVILGCTHFLHLVAEFEEAAGPALRVVDSRSGVVRRALEVARPCDCSAADPLDKTLFVTGGAASEPEYRLVCAGMGLRWGGALCP